MKFCIIIILVGFVCACATPAENRLKRVESIALAFRPLEANIDKTCRVQVDLSAPTEEKYKRSFPDEAQEIVQPIEFVWDVRTKRCQLKIDEASTPFSKTSAPWKKNHQVVVKAAFCTLLQGFAVESPFSGLSLLPADVNSSGEWIQILSVQTRRPVLELHGTQLTLRATSNLGQNFLADYEIKYRWPRPTSIRLESREFQLSLSDFAFQTFNNGEVSSMFPREIEAFSIFTRDSTDTESKLYARATIKKCD